MELKGKVDKKQSQRSAASTEPVKVRHEKDYQKGEKDEVTKPRDKTDLIFSL